MRRVETTDRRRRAIYKYCLVFFAYLYRRDFFFASHFLSRKKLFFAGYETDCGRSHAVALCRPNVRCAERKRLLSKGLASRTQRRSRDPTANGFFYRPFNAAREEGSRRGVFFTKKKEKTCDFISTSHPLSKFMYNSSGPRRRVLSSSNVS